MNALTLVVSCEHAGHEIPPEYRHLFAGRERFLRSHRGWDRGARNVAQGFADTFDAPLFYSTITRQLIDLNRTATRNLFSGISRGLPPDERQRVLDDHYQPYRQRVESWIARRIEKNQNVLHLSVHSFTPMLRGVRRQAEIGLLYDPARTCESQLCKEWKCSLREVFPGWRIRRNYPYRGRDDGFTTYLRTRFPAAAYLGIELEFNQRLLITGHVSDDEVGWLTGLCLSLKQVLHRRTSDSSIVKRDLIHA